MEQRANYFIDPMGEIGSGGYGVVERVKLYNSADHLCGIYARKFLISDGSDPDIPERFRREVYCQCHCVHKNVVQIYICNLDAPKPWFIMELAKSSLDDEIEKGHLNDKDKIKIIEDVLKGLSYIHKCGYLHRDIKPLNILRFSDNIYKLSDFGLAKSINPDAKQFATRVGQYLGSEKYFDYEIMAHGYSPQSDIYSIGVLMEDLYVDGLDDIIHKCKHRQLNKRYGNVEQIIAELQKLEVK
jgi:serine/threonine-protein kinase